MSVSPPTSVLRDEIASAVDAVASSATPPLATALHTIARFARCDWPADEELSTLLKTAEDVAALGRDNDELASDSLARLGEAERARDAAAHSLEFMVAAAAAPATTSEGRLIERLSALETHTFNLQLKLERAAAEVAGLRDENVRVGVASQRAAADASAAREAAATATAAAARHDAESTALRRRVHELELMMADVRRLLEAAASIAAAHGSD